MRTFLKIFAVLVILIIVFVVSIPASVIDSNLAKATNDEWRVAQTSGTIWRGGGMLTRTPNTMIVPVHWRFEPSALLRGAARWRLEGKQETPSLNATLSISRSGITIEGLKFEVFASSLQSFLPKKIVQMVDGQIELNSPKLLLNDENQLGAIQGKWRNANIMLYDTPIALGNVDFSMNADAQGRSGTVRNQGGAVQLEGDFPAASKGRLKITPRDDASPEILQLLSTFAQPDASGAYVLQMQ